MRHQLAGLCLCLMFALTSGDVLALKPSPTPEASMPATSVITFNGQVVYQSLEGGFWGLIDDAGRHYVPEGLMPAFQHNGLRVRVRASLAEETFGIEMWGTRIRLLDIQKIEGVSP